MKRKLKRIISVVLTLLVLLSAVSAYTFAEPSGDDDVIIDIDILAFIIADLYKQ